MTVLRYPGGFDAFCERMRELADDATRGVGPRDDPPPFVAWGREYEGDHRITVIPLPPFWLGDRATKQALATEVMVPAIVAGRCEYAAIASAAWTAVPGSPLAEEVQRLSEVGAPIPAFDDLGLDGLLEEVTVLACSAEAAVMHRATMRRTAIAPPRLAEWESFDNVKGHWSEPIQAALAEVASARGGS